MSWNLPAATASLTITHWADRGNRDRYWLVGADGGLFDLSLAAFKLHQLESPLVIPKVPAGAWSVVRLDSAGAFSMLAGGGAASLPKLTQISIASGQHKDISMQSGDTSGTR